MKKWLQTIAFVSSIALASQAFALDLVTAKQTGQVGEQPDGYIGAVKPSEDVNALVRAVNIKRREAYISISKENGQSLDVVETLAAKKLYDKLQNGEYYKSDSGAWKTK